jgi:hypothetical protein
MKKTSSQEPSTSQPQSAMPAVAPIQDVDEVRSSIDDLLFLADTDAGSEEVADRMMALVYRISRQEAPVQKACWDAALKALFGWTSKPEHTFEQHMTELISA